MPDRSPARRAHTASASWTPVLAFTAALACANGTPSSSPPDPAGSHPAQPSVAQPQEPPERISIHSVQSAWRVTEETLAITHAPQGFVAREHPIDGALVLELLRATAAPLEPQLNPDRLKPFLGDVRAEAERAGLSPLVAQHFASRALQPENLGKIMKHVEASRVYDDYPSLQIEIAWPSGVSLTLKSQSQHPLMLPWTVNGSGVTWNPDISRAVAALLPEQFLERDRVAGKLLTGVVAWYGRELFADEIGTEEAEERFGRELGPLRRRFRIEDGRVVGRFRLNTRSADRVWCGKLLGAPSDQFGFSLCLSAKEKLASFEPFLRDADALLARARKVPWLSRFAAANADAEILIEYLDDSSLSSYARGTILYDLEHLFHDSESASTTDAELARSLGVTIQRRNGTGTWVVLPDERGLFLYGKPFGAVEPELPSGRLIQADGTGGVSEAERPALARQAKQGAELQERARHLQDSVRSSFLKAKERLRKGTLTDEDRRAFSAPIEASSSDKPAPSSDGNLPRRSLDRRFPAP